METKAKASAKTLTLVYADSVNMLEDLTDLADHADIVPLYEIDLAYQMEVTIDRAMEEL